MDSISDIARPVIDATLWAAQRRAASAARRRASAEATLARLRHPEEDPYGRPEAGWSPARRHAREAFRAAHRREARARDDVAAIESATGPGRL
jgi:uncharacterized membrane protein